jgi:DNA-binding NarL/FixJ family response regulator
MVHLFRDVTPTRRLVSLVRERLAAPDRDAAHRQVPLTRRQVEVLRLAAAG